MPELTTIEALKRRRVIEDAIKDIIQRNSIRYSEILKYYGGSLDDNNMNGINSFNLDKRMPYDDNVIVRGINPHRDVMHKCFKLKNKIRIFR